MKMTLVTALLTLTWPTLTGAVEPAPAPMVFRDVTVIDGTGAGPRAGMTVVIEAGRISAMEARDDVAIPEGARVVEARGKFLIPGLWDMHVHFTDRSSSPLFLAKGVTGVRVMWGNPPFGFLPIHNAIKDAIRDGKLLGPRMVVASNIVDGPKPIWPGSITARTAEDGRKAVTKAKEAGADFVKVYSLVPRDAYFALAEEAKVRAIPFAGHLPLAIGAAEASDAGQKSFEHLYGIAGSCSTRERELRDELVEAMAKTPDFASIRPLVRAQSQAIRESYSEPKARELFAKFQANQTWQCPTLTVLRAIASLHDEAFRDDPRMKYVSAATKAFWNPKNDFRFKDTTPEQFAEMAKDFERSLELVGAMRRAGLAPLILAGTDEFNPYCFPGFSLHDELGLLVRAGLTPMEALQAATRNPARFLGKEATLGTIEVGKAADLVLLDADPLADIANTRAIRAVVADGRLLDRAALDKILEEAEAAAAGKKAAANDAVREGLTAGFCPSH